MPPLEQSAPELATMFRNWSACPAKTRRRRTWIYRTLILAVATCVAVLVVLRALQAHAGMWAQVSPDHIQGVIAKGGS